MRFYFVLFFFICSTVSYAQKKQKKLADAYFAKHEYGLAVPLFETLLEQEFDKQLLPKLAVCYDQLHFPEKALHIYHRLYKGGDHSDPIVNGYVRSLIQNENYYEARKIIRQFNIDQKEDFEHKTLAATCDSALNWKGQRSGYIVTNLRKLNTPYSEIGAVGIDQGIVFSSSRESTIIKRNYGYSGQPYFDLYISKRKKTGEYRHPKSLSEYINGIHHETSATFDSKNQYMYFSRVLGNHKNKEGKTNFLKLFRAERIDNKWKNVEPFMCNDSSASFGHPSISRDGKMFFFVSDMAGGYGGTDIYVSVRIDSSWSEPINLGPEINTPGNELYPFFHTDGILYFSSNGHAGFGGYDIFYVKDEGGYWSGPKNMKTPVNSSKDDFSIWLNEKKTKGFITSNRKGGLGHEDIYMLMR